MSGKRKYYSSEFKYKLAVEAIKKDNASEISRKYNIAPAIVCEWKNQLMSDGHNVFKTSPDKENQKMKKVIGKLEQMLGRKEVELNLLKIFRIFTSPKILRDSIRS